MAYDILQVGTKIKSQRHPPENNSELGICGEGARAPGREGDAKEEGKSLPVKPGFSRRT